MKRETRILWWSAMLCFFFPICMMSWESYVASSAAPAVVFVIHPVGIILILAGFLVYQLYRHVRDEEGGVS